jgi:hypothetical protein
MSVVQEAKEKVKAQKKANKQPKTIKVKTVVIAVAFIIALTLAFIGGTLVAKADSNRVTNEARALVQTLKSKK